MNKVLRKKRGWDPSTVMLPLAVSPMGEKGRSRREERGN